MPFALKHARHATAMSRNSAKNGRRFESKDQIYKVTCKQSPLIEAELDPDLKQIAALQFIFTP